MPTDGHLGGDGRVANIHVHPGPLSQTLGSDPESSQQLVRRRGVLDRDVLVNAEPALALGAAGLL